MLWFKRSLIALIFLVLSFYVFVVCLRNHALVDLDLFFIAFTQIKLELLLVASFIVGGFAGVLASLLMMWRMRSKHSVEVYKLERQNQLMLKNE